MPTILLVDDHVDIREMLTAQLRNQGYSVVTANNGIEAISAVAKSPPALILMDINMPQLDGYEATVQIRALDPGRQIPVIALTAYALPSDEARSMAAGCDAFHPKPINFEKLFKQISQLIKGVSMVKESAAMD